MTDVQQLVDQAVYARLSGDGTLSGLATGGVWQTIAPEGSTPPYLLYAQYGDAASPWTFSNPQPYTLFEYQMRAISNSDVDFSITQSILAQVYVLLSNYALTVTGYSTMVCRRSHIGAPAASGLLAGIPVLSIAHRYEIGVS